MNRYAMLRQQAADLRSKAFTGGGVVRGLGAGQWFTLSDHPAHKNDGDADRQFVVLKQTVQARNNLPSGFSEDSIGAAAKPPASLTLEEAGYRQQVHAVRRSVPIVPEYAHTEHAKPTARGIQTATVVGPAGEEIFTDDLGRIKIQFHWARPQDHDQNTHGASADRNDFSSCWVRVGYPSAGANWGHQFIPRIGQEVVVTFIDNDIDRPVVAAVIHNGQQTPPAFSGAGSLPANKTLAGIKSREHHGGGYNELVFDDTTGQLRTKLSSEHGKTQLNQGFLIHPRTEGEGEPRGEGFELRTDKAGALRAAQGLLLTTEAQPEAKGKQLDRKTALALLDAATQQADQLGDSAKSAQANQPETGKNKQTINADWRSGSAKPHGHLHHIKEAAHNLERKSNTDKDGTSGQGDQQGQQPLLAVSGQGGISVTTPQSLAMTTGTNLDHIALGDHHHTTGRRWIANAAESISLFVSGARNTLKESIKLIAAKGNVQMQAQSADIEIDGDQSLTITACKDTITASAKEEITLTCGGAQIKLSGGNIEVIAPGNISLKGAKQPATSGTSMNLTPPHLPQSEIAPSDLEFRYVNWIGEAIAGERYRATLSDGSVHTGMTDAQGHFRITGLQPGTMAKVEYLGNTQSAKSTTQAEIDDDVQGFLNHAINAPANKDGV